MASAKPKKMLRSCALLNGDMTTVKNTYQAIARCPTQRWGKATRFWLLTTTNDTWDWFDLLKVIKHHSFLYHLYIILENFQRNLALFPIGYGCACHILLKVVLQFQILRYLTGINVENLHLVRHHCFVIVSYCLFQIPHSVSNYARVLLYISFP